MARYKLSATAVLLQVCRLSAEANGPTDLLHRVNNIDDQHMAARDGGVGAHHRTGSTTTVTSTRMYRGNNNFVDPSEYSDGEAVSLTPTGGHNVPNAAGDGDRNRMRARRMERIRAKTRTEPANGKTTTRAGRKGPPPTLPRGTINSTPDIIDMDPTPDQDTELDHFRTDHIFDPHYNGDDVIEVENEMRDGGATFQYDERNFNVDFGCFPFDMSYPVFFSPDFPSWESGKKSKSGSAGGAAAAGSSSKSSKSSRASEVGGDDNDIDGESPNSSKSYDDNASESPKSSKGGDADDNAGESPKSSKSSKNNRSASLEQSRRQRYRALRKNGRNLRGDGEVDEDRMAALREEEDPSLQGVVAVIAAHQRREDRQRQKKLQRRRNRTPEEKARDRALVTSARRR